MAAALNHDLWKDCMRREEKIRNRFKKKSDGHRFKFYPKLLPVYERQTTTIKREKFYAPPVSVCEPIHQNTYTCNSRRQEITEDIPPITCIPAEVSQDHRPALHLVNSCPQIKTLQLPIFHKSASSANMVKMEHECAERAVVQKEYLRPLVVEKHHYPIVHKTEKVKLEPHFITAIGDQGIPFRERWLIVKK
ncbi:hypothetical protein HNY73_017594 [Argiope bruennichi]|uniref:Uncharacterized protein n=1 Tax=Argiope bruennichi TaxID=94029 RepID=A0A8T0EBE4_ARGBR|nr:hypothetical protein HNY73_017594 [Argiope bruennichi]